VQAARGIAHPICPCPALASRARGVPVVGVRGGGRAPSRRQVGSTWAAGL